MVLRLPGVTGLTSYLSGCFQLTSQRCGFSHRRTFWKVSRLAGQVLPVTNTRFVTSLDMFLGPALIKGPNPRAACAVLIRGSSHYPLGNRDSSMPETSIDYLTRLEAVSNRFLPLSS